MRHAIARSLISFPVGQQSSKFTGILSISEGPGMYAGNDMLGKLTIDANSLFYIDLESQVTFLPL